MILWEYDDRLRSRRRAADAAPSPDAQRAFLWALMADLFRRRLETSGDLQGLELAAYYQEALRRHSVRQAATP